MPSEAPPPVWKPVAGRVVILDAGHGGHDDGAAHHGLREKDVNLDVVLRTAAWLRAQGVTVRMTRDRDVFVPLPERSKMANRNPNALFVSIHSNAAAGGPNPFGVETFVLTSSFSDEERCRTALSRYNVPGNSREESRKTLRELTIRCRAQGPELATSIQRSLVRRLGEPDRGVKRADLAVLRETFFCPAVLVEIGFMSHPPTARKMVTPAWRDQAAAAIGEGIVDYMRRIG
jgi:N-acetylmuramoyl-L-alanine amidase